MHTNQDIYIAFRKAQSKAIERPYKLPKDWEYFYNVEMTEKNKEYLDKATANFNTIWQNFDPIKYFNVGFELFGKRFGYHKFLSKKIIMHYIEKDKHYKRDVDGAKRDIIDSAKYVLSVCHDLYQYCNRMDGRLSLPVSDYLRNKIDKYFLVWLMRKGYLHLSDDEYISIPYINEKFSEYKRTVLELDHFFDSIRRKFND
jgi:hypothetical protein